MAKKQFTTKDVAQIIYDAILDSPKITPDLITTINAVVKSFVTANNVIVYEKNEETRKHAAEIANIRAVYYRRELTKLVANMEPYYKEVEQRENEYKSSLHPVNKRNT
jgi:hypothetical protein